MKTSHVTLAIASVVASLLACSAGTGWSGVKVTGEEPPPQSGGPTQGGSSASQSGGQPNPAGSSGNSGSSSSGGGSSSSGGGGSSSSGGGAGFGPKCRDYLDCCDEVAIERPEVKASCDQLRATQADKNSLESQCDQLTKAAQQQGYCK
jgi:hypothetical protein